MRIILLCFLTILSTHAWAEWTAIVKNDEATYFADIDKVVSAADIRRVETKGVQSSKSQCRNNLYGCSWRSVEEFDCKFKRFRVLSTTYYSAFSADGTVSTVDSKPSEWFMLDTWKRPTSERIMSLVCR